MKVIEKKAYIVSTKTLNPLYKPTPVKEEVGLSGLGNNVSEYRYETHIIVTDSINKVIKHFGEENIEVLELRGSGIYIS